MEHNIKIKRKNNSGGYDSLYPMTKSNIVQMETPYEGTKTVDEEIINLRNKVSNLENKTKWTTIFEGNRSIEYTEPWNNLISMDTFKIILFDISVDGYHNTIIAFPKRATESLISTSFGYYDKSKQKHYLWQLSFGINGRYLSYYKGIYQEINDTSSSVNAGVPSSTWKANTNKIMVNGIYGCNIF